MPSCRRTSLDEVACTLCTHNVILDGPAAWRPWIELLRTYAECQDIWEFIDPNEARVPELVEPTFPRAWEVDPGATSFANLSEDDKDTLRFLERMYDRDIDRYGSRRKAIKSMLWYIQQHVAIKYQEFTFGCKDAHEMLRSLKDRFAPSW